MNFTYLNKKLTETVILLKTHHRRLLKSALVVLSKEKHGSSPEHSEDEEHEPIASHNESLATNDLQSNIVQENKNPFNKLRNLLQKHNYNS